MKPLFITLSGGSGNPAEVTLNEALQALYSRRFDYLDGADLGKLQNDLRDLARGLVIAAMNYRDEHPKLDVRYETIDELLRVNRS